MGKLLRGLRFLFQFGPLNCLHAWKNSRLIPLSVVSGFEVKGSSITDSEISAAYPTLCGLAASSDNVFKEFRKYEVLIQALDHVSIQQGFDYLDEVMRLEPWNKTFSSVIRHIDSIGNPNKFKFGNYGTFSPTLIRYLKVYLEIKKELGEFDNQRVSEIGVGFGGQATLINLLSNPSSYRLFDIPPVLDLAKKFGKTIGVEDNFCYFDGRAPVPCDSDILISNYAFSELARDVQETYLENVILKSKRGYITWNDLSTNQLGGYSLSDLIRIIPNSEILPERPRTDLANAVIIWK